MDDVKARLERAIEMGTRVRPLHDDYERFTTYRDRRRRSQRIGSAIVALLLAALAIGGAASVLGVERGSQPASTITRQDAANLRIAWSSQIPGSPASTGARPFAPVVADGLIYVATGDGSLYAFPESCATRGPDCPFAWQAHFRLGGEDVPVPVAANGWVYVSADGKVLAFASSCGSGGATCQPSVLATSGGGIGTPVVDGGHVFVAQTEDGSVAAFAADCGRDGATCQPLWSAPTGGDVYYPILVDGVVYAVVESDGNDAQLLAWDAGTGASIWRATVPGGVSSLLAAEGHVYVNGDALASYTSSCASGGSTCVPDWDADVRGPAQLASAGSVYAVGGDLSSWTISAIPIDCGRGGATCRPAWQAIIPPASGIAADGSHVYVASERGAAIRAFPVTCSGTCSPTWEYTMPDGPSGRNNDAYHTPYVTPVLGNGVVFVATGASPVHGGRLNAFSTSCRDTCDPLWTWESDPHSGLSDPVVADDTLFVTSSDGRLLAFTPGPNDAEASQTSSTSVVAGVVVVTILAVGGILAVRRRVGRRPTP